MSSKRVNTSESDTPTKRRRKVMSLADKVEVLDLLKSGVSVAAVSRQYGVNESTIRCIKKVEDKIRTSFSSSSPLSSKVSYVCRRDSLLEKMEKILSEWIDGQNQESAPLSGYVIRNKALQLYEQLKSETEGSSSTSFLASKGWFENFKKRFGFHKNVGESAQGDPEAAKEFRRELKCLGEAEGVSQEGELAPEELVELSYSSGSEEEEEEDRKPQKKQITPEALEEILKMAERLKERVAEVDPDFERSTEFARSVVSAVAPYVELFRDIQTDAGQHQDAGLFTSNEMKYTPTADSEFSSSLPLNVAIKIEKPD